MSPSSSARDVRRVIGTVAATLLAVGAIAATARGVIADDVCSAPGRCPAITSVLPSALPFNRNSDTTLTVNGTRLNVVSSVLLEPGGAPLQFQLEAPDHMSVTLPNQVGTGDRWLVLTSPFGDSDHNPGTQFTIVPPSLNAEATLPAVSFDPAPGSTPAPSATPAAKPVAVGATSTPGPGASNTARFVGAGAAVALLFAAVALGSRRALRGMAARRRLRAGPTGPPPAEEFIRDRLGRL